MATWWLERDVGGMCPKRSVGVPPLLALAEL